MQLLIAVNIDFFVFLESSTEIYFSELTSKLSGKDSLDLFSNAYFNLVL